MFNSPKLQIDMICLSFGRNKWSEFFVTIVSKLAKEYYISFFKVVLKLDRKQVSGPDYTCCRAEKFFSYLPASSGGLNYICVSSTFILDCLKVLMSRNVNKTDLKVTKILFE